MSFIELAIVIQENLRRMGSWASPSGSLSGSLSISYILALPPPFRAGFTGPYLPTASPYLL